MKFKFKSLKTFHFTLEHSRPESPKLAAQAVLSQEDLDLLILFASNRKCSVDSLIGEIVHNWLVEQEFLKRGTIILTNGDGAKIAEYPDSERGMSDAASFALKLYTKDLQKYPVNGGFSFVEVKQDGKRIPHLQKVMDANGNVKRV